MTYWVSIFVAGNRVEDMLFEKIEKRRPNRLSNLEYLGLDMVQAGNDFGPGTAYGKYISCLLDLFYLMFALLRILK